MRTSPSPHPTMGECRPALLPARLECLTTRAARGLTIVLLRRSWSIGEIR